MYLEFENPKTRFKKKTKKYVSTMFCYFFSGEVYEWYVIIKSLMFLETLKTYTVKYHEAWLAVELGNCCILSPLLTLTYSTKLLLRLNRRMYYPKASHVYWKSLEPSIQKKHVTIIRKKSLQYVETWFY